MQEESRRKAYYSSGNKKKSDKKGKGKGKEKAKESLNLLSIVEVLDMLTFNTESNKFSCYIEDDRVEWLLDSGCTEHHTSEE